MNYELEYNNAQRFSDLDRISTRWKAGSDAFRTTARALLDQPYGSGERQRYDLFLGGTIDGPLVIYIHGGYWQRGDRAVYSFLARALNAEGVNVALPSYSLCPTVSVVEIVSELRCCLATIWAATNVHPVVVGHSAGGHLTSAMLATDWNAVNGVPPDLVRAGVSISGVFDLRPLVTTTINHALGLDRDTARAASPRYWPPPTARPTLVAAVGGNESSEFLRQSRDIVEHWGLAGIQTEYLEIPDTNHFTVLDTLATPPTPLFERTLTLALQTRG